ncbi:MAG: hypothetical protein N2657_00740 [bacterium]|nr:hypothetical protein [bacterium]
MIDNLPLIYRKIKSIGLYRGNDFENTFQEICSLIDSYLEKGYLWISFYSYYNLFYNILLHQNQSEDIFYKYFFILSKIEDIMRKITLTKEEAIEMILNNPFNDQEFLDKLRNRLGEEKYNLVRSRIDMINSVLPQFKNEDILSLYSSLSIHNFLKLIRILKEKVKIEEIIEMILNDLYDKDMKGISIDISEIIDFGIKNRDDEFISDFIQRLFVKFVLYLNSKSSSYKEWKKTFIISTYENVSRYFRIVKDYPISCVIYLLASIENWYQKSYGYGARCLYRISRMVENPDLSVLLTTLAIQIASLEVSFEEDINLWKREIFFNIRNLEYDEIKHKFELFLESLKIDQKLIGLVKSKLSSFLMDVFNTLRLRRIKDLRIEMN